MSDPDAKAQLDRIAEISRNARTTWFGLIFVLLFCGVALLDVQDRDFFEYGAATQLPLLGVQVPVVGFFVTAPLLVLGLYVYLHIYLAKLWLELGDAPAQPNGVDLDRAVFPWLISDAALRLRKDVRERPFGWISSLASLTLAWLFGPVVIGAFWVRSWPYHEEVLTLYLGALLLIALWIGWDSWTTCRRTVRGQVPGDDWYRWPVGVVLGTIIGAIGWETTEGGIAKTFGINDDETAFLWRTNLSGADLVQMPIGWMGSDRAFREYRRKHSAFHAREAQDTSKISSLESEFDEQRREKRATLKSYSFEKADLRHTNLVGAFLVSTNLIEARLDHAVMFNVQLEGSVLTRAEINEVRLESAHMKYTIMPGVKVTNSSFKAAKMQKSYISDATMKNVDLQLARMDGVNLSRAKIISSNLNRAVIKFSNLNGTDFTGSEGLTQEMIEGAFGNLNTRIPDNLSRPEHWVREELGLGDLHERWCSWLRDQNQSSQFC